ncbi:MAG: EVE domain-containing protein [candidate division Zixibacteria bacterium]|nr:EVE domain-containing protein [candidate division Zixibacteria bacterium]
MAKRYWLFKSEPDTFSIDDLQRAPKGVAVWDGVRNYQARNMLRDIIKVGDEVFFYHSRVQPPGIAGICRVVREGFPDKSALELSSQYYDPKVHSDKPVWYAVEVQFVLKLPKIIPLEVLKKTPGLQKMMVTRKGNRLSIQPVTSEEWKIIMVLMKNYR